MAIIESAALIEWLAAQRKALEIDEQHYKKGGDTEQEERCQYQESVYTKIIDHLTRKSNAQKS